MALFCGKPILGAYTCKIWNFYDEMCAQEEQLNSYFNNELNEYRKNAE